MKTVEARVLTLEQGLVVATQLSLPVSQIVEAFGVKVLPTKTALKKMLTKADLQKMWAIYRGFEAVLRFNGSGFWRSGQDYNYQWSGFVQEQQVILFSIEELLQRTLDETTDPKDLRKLLGWMDKDRHKELRSSLIDKLGRSIREVIPNADPTMRKWIREEGVLNDHSHNGILELLQVEDDKHYQGLINDNTDPWTLLLVCDSVASEKLKAAANAKALENSTTLSQVWDVSRVSGSSRWQRCRALDKYVDLAGDEKDKLWQAVRAEYKEDRDDFRPRSKALAKLLALNDGDLEDLFKIDRWSLQAESFPHDEMGRKLLEVVNSTNLVAVLQKVREHIKKMEKLRESSRYREVTLAVIRRLYELSQSK